jgi:hypothetical protein
MPEAGGSAPRLDGSLRGAGGSLRGLAASPAASLRARGGVPPGDGRAASACSSRMRPASAVRSGSAAGGLAAGAGGASCCGAAWDVGGGSGVTSPRGGRPRPASLGGRGAAGNEDRSGGAGREGPGWGGRVSHDPVSSHGPDSRGDGGPSQGSVARRPGPGDERGAER